MATSRALTEMRIAPDDAGDAGATVLVGPQMMAAKVVKEARATRVVKVVRAIREARAIRAGSLVKVAKGARAGSLVKVAKVVSAPIEATRAGMTAVANVSRQSRAVSLPVSLLRSQGC